MELDWDIVVETHDATAAHETENRWVVCAPSASSLLAFGRSGTLRSFWNGYGSPAGACTLAFSIGSPGGATIITTVLQTIFNHIDLGMPMPQAVDAPRLSERNGMATDVEPGYAALPAAQALAQRGQHWSMEPEEIGAANALVFNPDGTVTAVSEGWRHGVGSALVQKSAH